MWPLREQRHEEPLDDHVLADHDLGNAGTNRVDKSVDGRGVHGGET